jgi:hypothetical protein
MRKLRLSAYYTYLSSLVLSPMLLFFPSSSSAKDVYGPEIRYESCGHLQKNMNRKNMPYVQYKGFGQSELRKRTYTENGYMVYCNNGTIINNDEKTTCTGYIGYAYFPKMGIAQYVGDWGWTNGSSNGDDVDKGSYCRRLK